MRHLAFATPNEGIINAIGKNMPQLRSIEINIYHAFFDLQSNLIAKIVITVAILSPISVSWVLLLID